MAKILLIDDSSWWLKRMSKMIQQMGHDVVTQNGMKAGLDAIFEEDPAAVVSDLLMPDGDGFEILKQLREKGKSVPVIVLTADFQQETIDLCKEMGAFEVLQKERVKVTLSDILAKALSVRSEGS